MQDQKTQLLRGVLRTLPQTLSLTQVLFSELDADKNGTVPDLVKPKACAKFSSRCLTNLRPSSNSRFAHHVFRCVFLAVAAAIFWGGNPQVNIKEMLSYVAHGPKRLSAARAAHGKGNGHAVCPMLVHALDLGKTSNPEKCKCY